MRDTRDLIVELELLRLKSTRKNRLLRSTTALCIHTQTHRLTKSTHTLGAPYTTFSGSKVIPEEIVLHTVECACAYGAGGLPPSCCVFAFLAAGQGSWKLQELTTRACEQSYSLNLSISVSPVLVLAASFQDAFGSGSLLDLTWIGVVETTKLQTRL